MAKEIELKFMVEEGCSGDIISWAENTSLIQGRPYQLVLDNRYFDTPTQKLYKNGIALRVRKTDNEVEMTIKTRVSKFGGLHVHPEYNVPLDSLPQVPDLSLFPREIFRNLSIDELEREIFQNMSQKCIRTIVNISNRSLNNEKFKIEMSFDKVTYQGKNIFGNELELELKEGSPVCLMYVAELLLHAISVKELPLKLRLGTVSKMQRAAIYAGISEIEVPTSFDISSNENIISSFEALEKSSLLSEEPTPFEKLSEFFTEIQNLEISDEVVQALKKIGQMFLEQCDKNSSLEAKRELFKNLLTNQALVLARIHYDFQQRRG